VLAVFGFTTPLWAYASMVSSAATNQPIEIYMTDRDTYDLGQILARQSGPDAVIVASLNTGNLLGGFIPGRVFVGHEINTPSATRKSRAVAALYQGALSEDAARRFLTQNGITHVVVGPEERKLGSIDPGAALDLPLEAEVGRAKAYAVSPRRPPR
jgi:hypothetical protein